MTLYISLDDGTYAMKKIIIQTEEQLELVRQEIRVSSLFSHPNLLPLLDHAIIPVKVLWTFLFKVLGVIMVLGKPICLLIIFARSLYWLGIRDNLYCFCIEAILSELIECSLSLYHLTVGVNSCTTYCINQNCDYMEYIKTSYAWWIHNWLI